MNNTFFAGSAWRSLIPPTDLLKQSPQSFSNVRAEVQGSPLKAKALALSLGQTSVILVTLDQCILYKVHADKIRQTISERIGLNTNQIIIHASHSHSTPLFESLQGPAPYFEFTCKQSQDAAADAWQSRRPATVGSKTTVAQGMSFNQRVHLPNARVYFTRDYREGLDSGRPVDQRLNVIRIDDMDGNPIAGWVRFAAHPACVIANPPISAEYPGYLTDRLSETVAKGAPVLFGYGASGDVNCVPMFGQEDDTKDLGLKLFELAAPVFDDIRTTAPHCLKLGNRYIKLPLDPPPSLETLDREIEEVRTFTEGLDQDPSLVWILGVNCGKHWSVETKKNYAAPLAKWARQVKTKLHEGHVFPSVWPSELAAVIVDEFGLLFFAGEPFTQLSLMLSQQSPLRETWLMAMSNGGDAYLGTDEDKRRGGYEIYTCTRYAGLTEGIRPLPYALGAEECFIHNAIDLIRTMH